MRDLVEIAFTHAGLDWQEHVRIDPAFLRPAEVDHLIGNPAKARADLDWEPTVDFAGLVRMMVDADIERLTARPPPIMIRRIPMVSNNVHVKYVSKTC